MLRFLGLVSVVIYATFDYFDGKRVVDEREQLIQLKSYELSHKVTLGTLAVFSAAYLFYPWIDAAYVIQALVLSALYTEIAGKLFYRRQI